MMAFSAGIGLAAWTVSLAVVLLRLFAWSSFRRKILRDGRPIRKAPNTLPLVGNGILFLQPRQKLFSWFVECERQTGYETLEISVPTLPPGVLINDPKNLDFVFKNEGTFTKGDFVKQRSWDLFGHGIINADGELWKAQRKAGLGFLSTANLRVLTDVALPRHIASSVALLQGRSDGTIVDLQQVFHEITTQLMGKMAYNMEMHADDSFTSAFDYASGVTAERFQNPLWFVTEIFFGAKFRRSVKTIKAFGQEIVARAASECSNQGDKVGNTTEDEGIGLDQVSGTLIKALVEAIGDEQIVADAALNYLSAGRDTTAQALTWTFHLLNQHPAVVSRVRSEVRDLLDSHGILNGIDLDTTLFTPRSMPFTLAVFYESLRLYPPIPFEIKQCSRRVMLPDHTFLPAGAVVLWCPWAMNRSRTTWGADADSFRPERWLVEQQPVSHPDEGGVSERLSRPERTPLSVAVRSAAEFPVFNGGPRLCLGKKMAEAVAVQVISTLVWLFDFAPADDVSRQNRVSKSSLTLPMDGGLPVLVKPSGRNPVLLKKKV